MKKIRLNHCHVLSTEKKQKGIVTGLKSIWNLPKNLIHPAETYGLYTRNEIKWNEIKRSNTGIQDE